MSKTVVRSKCLRLQPKPFYFILFLFHDLYIFNFSVLQYLKYETYQLRCQFINQEIGTSYTDKRTECTKMYFQWKYKDNSFFLREREGDAGE